MQKLELAKQNPKSPLLIKAIFTANTHKGRVLTIGVRSNLEPFDDYAIFLPLEDDELLELNNEEVFYMVYQNIPSLDVNRITQDGPVNLDVDDVGFKQSLRYVFDYLAQQCGGYAVLQENFEIGGMLEHYINAALIIKPSGHPLAREVVVASDLKKVASILEYIYKVFTIPSFSPEDLENFNFVYWSILTMLTACNSLVIPNTDKPTFSGYAQEKLPFTIERLNLAIQHNLAYFDEKQIKFEINVLAQQNMINPIKRSEIIHNVFHTGRNGTYDMSYIDAVHVRSLISVLYRNYVAKPQEDKIIKSMSKEIMEAMLILQSGQIKSAKILDGLFELKVVIGDKQNRFGVEVFPSDAVMSKLKPSAKYS